jgi:hypothetical protein
MAVFCPSEAIDQEATAMNLPPIRADFHLHVAELFLLDSSSCARPLEAARLWCGRTNDAAAGILSAPPGSNAEERSQTAIHLAHFSLVKGLYFLFHSF